MRRKHLYTTTLFIVFLYFFAVVAILALSREVEVGKLLLSARIRERAEETLDGFRDEFTARINEQAYERAEEIFEEVDASFPEEASASEEKKLHRFLMEYEKGITEQFGEPWTVVTTLFNDIQRENYREITVGSQSGLTDGRIIRLNEKIKPILEKRYGANGEIKSCFIRNVGLLYYKEFELIESRVYDLEIPVPSVHFYSGNDVLFDYSILAGKGIYLTGRTSSIVGNVYAGTHTPSEFRQAEARYGEKEIFGGINVLGTQVGIDADTVVTTGNINVKQSFLMLGLDDSPIRIYAQALNRLDGFGSRRDVTVIGETELTPSSAEYRELLAKLSEGMSKLSELSDYYDSNNDKSYKGRYRKILSNYDVIITGSFTGAVVTAGNVIVEADADVAGIIIAGDRVYIQGNNNIVSDEEILRYMIDEEYYEEKAAGKQSRNEFYISHYLKDYIGNIQFRGVF